MAAKRWLDGALRALEAIGRSRRRGPIVQAVLWVGFALCAVAALRLGDVFLAQVQGISTLAIGVALLLLYGSLLFSVAAWRQFLAAYTGDLCQWRTALRQSAYLLIGKYFPGGVVGFAARVFDQPDENRGRLVVSGLVEQVAALSVLIAIGCILYLAAWMGRWLPVLLIAPSIPVIVMGADYLGRILRAYIFQQNDVGCANRSRLACAVSLSVLQQIVGAAFIVVMAMSTLEVSFQEAVGIAASFALAVAAGMLMVFVPGGIGVREVFLVWFSGLWLDTRDSVALAAALRVVSTLLDLSFGLIALVFFRPKISSPAQVD